MITFNLETVGQIVHRGEESKKILSLASSYWHSILRHFLLGQYRGKVLKTWFCQQCFSLIYITSGSTKQVAQNQNLLEYVTLPTQLTLPNTLFILLQFTRNSYSLLRKSVQDIFMLCCRYLTLSCRDFWRQTPYYIKVFLVKIILVLNTKSQVTNFI